MSKVNQTLVTYVWYASSFLYAKFFDEVVIENDYGAEKICSACGLLAKFRRKIWKRPVFFDSDARRLHMSQG